jgi:hypothetical protein
MFFAVKPTASSAHLSVVPLLSPKPGNTTSVSSCPHLTDAVARTFGVTFIAPSRVT